MRLDLVPDGFIERIALSLGAVPTPWLISQSAVLLARAGMAACKLGLFEALSKGPLTAEEVSKELALDPTATAALLEALVSMGDVLRDRNGAYANSSRTQKWLVPSSPTSLHDNMLWRYIEWDALSGLEDYIRTGRPVDVHSQGDPLEVWRTYQGGMASLAALMAEEIVERVPFPAPPRSLLDVGGGHGAVAAAFAQKHPTLKARVLDLPEAVAAGRDIAKVRGYDDRVTFETGDAREGSFGTDVDAVLLLNVLHHFTASEIPAVLTHARTCLSPTGRVIVSEPFRIPARRSGQLGALFNLFFQMLSGAAMPSTDEVRSQLETAGFTRIVEKALRKAQGVKLLIAEIPS